MKKYIQIIIITFSFLFILILAACDTIIPEKFNITYSYLAYDYEGNLFENKSTSVKYETGTILTKETADKDSNFNIDSTKWEIDDWYLDDKYTDKVVFPFTIIKNKTIYLKLNYIGPIPEPVEYKVIFYNEDEIYEESLIKQGDSISAPTDPLKDGYSFGGWFNEALTYQYAFPYEINNDTNFYAKWNKLSDTKYNVNYMDGSTILKTIEVYEGASASSYIPSKDNYVFDGWYADANFNNEFDFDSIIRKNTNIYSKWLKSSFDVKFMDGSDVLKTINVQLNSLAESYTPAKDGYKFSGWYTDITYTKVFNFETPITKDTSIYAKWIQSDFKVTYMDGSNILKTIDAEAGKALESYNPTKEHYTFDGWYTDSLLVNKFNESTLINKDYTLYSKWIIDSFKVTYYVGSTIFNVENVNYNSKANGPSSNPSKEGFAFEGWYTDPDFGTKYNFSTKVTSSFNLYANFEEFNNIAINSYSGYNEGIYIKLPNTGINTDNYTISYSIADANDYKEIDNQLIRLENSEIRADILGISANKYDVKIEVSGLTEIIKNIQVYEQDRSGYAHFNYSAGVGAYNNDGTLKPNTKVIYVTDSNKNTITYNGKTGLVNILKNPGSNPLCIRLLDTIKTCQFNAITYTSTANSSALVNEQAASFGGNKAAYTAAQIISNGYNSYSNDLANGITELNNLTSRSIYKNNEFDTYWNMCDISSVSKITIEGVGENAGLFQWGFTWSNCNSIEVKNLTFTDYPEDACSFQGGSNSTVKSYGNYWIHNCTFNKGKNNWDLTYEQDKHYGDGATDFKFCNSITSSYNVFNNCKKTGLVGGSNDNYTMNVTFHHNYYNNVGSRLPLGRQANMHFYNNYYYNCSTCQDIRANAFVLSESNYFDGCSNPQKVSKDDTYAGTVIKSYNDYLTGCGSSQATAVTSRAQTLSGNCKPDGSTNYTNFDTNSNLFYYDSTNEKSDVTIMNEVSDVPSIVSEYAGAGSNYYKSILVTQANVTKYTITLMNGSTVFDTIKVIENTAAKKPSTYPTSSSGIFEAWVDENNNEYNWSNLVNSDIVLYAKYKSEPTYESLANNSNAIIAEDFNNSTANQKLTKFTDYNTKGIYYSNNGTNADSTAYAIYTGSSIKTVDDDSSCAAQINVSFGQEYKSGIIKGWVELSIGTNVGSKWALISFVDENNQVLFKLGADSNKNLAYAVSNTAMEAGTSLISNGVSKNTTFKIYYEFDLNNGTTSLIINNVTYLNNYNTGIYELAGFYTMTNGSGTDDSARVITLDNIAVVKEN